MNESKATRYQRFRRRARVLDVALAGLMLAVIALTPLSVWLSARAEAFATGLSGMAERTVALLVFVTLVVVLWELAALPAVIYLALYVDRRYGQTAPSIEEVLGAQARATGIAAVAAFVAGGIVLVSAAVGRGWWWVVAGVLLAGALATALRVAPAVLARLADVRPLTRDHLVERLAGLARRAKVPIAGIAEWRVGESARTTALVTGVGRGRRVLLSSDLVRDWSDDEIAVVVAHELAHHVYRDLWRTLALDVLVLWVALFAADIAVRFSAALIGGVGPGDLAALPLIALVASGVWTIMTPVRHAQSRWQERRADVFALGMTGGAEAFGAAIRRLGARLLAEEHPTALTQWLYHRHPPIAERLALAEAFRSRSRHVGESAPTPERS